MNWRAEPQGKGYVISDGRAKIYFSHQAVQDLRDKHTSYSFGKAFYELVNKNHVRVLECGEYLLYLGLENLMKSLADDAKTIIQNLR